MPVTVSKLIEDIIIQEVNIGSAWVPRYGGIRLIHIPTRTVIESLDAGSPVKNRIACMERLDKILKYSTEMSEAPIISDKTTLDELPEFLKQQAD